MWLPKVCISSSNSSIVLISLRLINRTGRDINYWRYLLCCLVTIAWLSIRICLFNTPIGILVSLRHVFGKYLVEKAALTFLVIISLRTCSPLACFWGLSLKFLWWVFILISISLLRNFFHLLLLAISLLKEWIQLFVLFGRNFELLHELTYSLIILSDLSFQSFYILCLSFLFLQLRILPSKFSFVFLNLLFSLVDFIFHIGHVLLHVFHHLTSLCQFYQLLIEVSFKLFGLILSYFKLLLQLRNLTRTLTISLKFLFHFTDHQLVLLTLTFRLLELGL